MMLSKKDLELYQKDVRQLIAETGDPNAFILFDGPTFEKIRKRVRKERKEAEKETS